MTYFQNIIEFSKTLKNIENMFNNILHLFPFNTSYEELNNYNIVLKKVSIAERTCFLLNNLPKYWNFQENIPGPQYNLELWREMLSYGFKF